ncbi:MAG TPA: amidohydrolase family protein [Dehalococcoidia bacterium]|nr:amidohydrolase family protein [Dehalococcoidia bacterium]
MDYMMISVDDHIDMSYLPRDLWTERLPSSMREEGPRVIETERGFSWVCGDRSWGDWRGGMPKGPAQLRYFKTALERGGVWEPGVLRPTIPELRLIDMSRDNIEASFMFGPISAFACDDPSLRTAIYEAYNDWLIDFCAYDARRLHGIAALPGEDVEASTAELYRLAKKGGVKQVNFLIGRANPKIYDDAWEPFWNAAEETGMIVSFHVGGGAAPAATPTQPRQERPSMVFNPSKGFINQFLDSFHGLIAEGVLDRHAGVKVMLAEVGLGWLPWVVHEMDYRYQRLLDNKAFWDERGGINLTMPPSDIWKRNFWVTFQDDPVGLALLKFCNEDQILWASDYPHPDSTFPDSVAIVLDQMKDITPVQQRKILRDNAIALYGLEDS